MPEVNPLALALPVFGGAILVEHWLLHRRGRRDAYHFRTAVADIDLGYYLWHRVSHLVNAMWTVHAVHHHSDDYNSPSRCGSRLTWTPFFCVLAVVGVPADVVLLSFGLNLFYQVWLHTELVGKLPRVLEWILNTPSHHREHHGIEPEYLDKNFGGMFVIWDRMFGTFELERRRPTYGTTTPRRSFNPLWANVAYFVRIGELAAQARTWREKLYAFAAHPAWRPDDVQSKHGARQPRFRPSVSSKAVRRAAALLVMVSAGLFVLLAFEAELSIASQAAVFGIVTAALVGVTAVLERQAWAGSRCLGGGAGRARVRGAAGGPAHTV